MELPLPTPRPEIGPGLELVTVAEAATQLRVSKMTIYRQVHDGVLPAIRIGRSFRIHRDDLDAFLAATGYTPEPPTGTTIGATG